MATILIIDDDEATRGTIALLLANAGHEVMEAGDGKAGIECYRTHAYDLVFTDMIMPEMEGLEVIAEIRRLNPRARLVAMSGGAAVSPQAYLRLAGHLGADRTLLKPFTAARLFATVAELLPVN